LNAVYALAECTNEEIESLPNYQKPFDLLVTLWVLPIDSSNAPTTIPTCQQDVLDQMDWLMEVQNAMSNIPAEYDIISSYTTRDENGIALGERLIDQAIEPRSDVYLRIEAYITTLSQEEEDALYQKLEERYFGDIDSTDAELFAQALAQFPDEFTIDNILDYASDFESLNSMVSYLYDMTTVNTEDLNKYERLAEEFEVIIGIHKDEVIQKLEQRIDEVCKIDEIAGYSQLKIALFVEEECQQLYFTIETIQDTLGIYADQNIDNLDTFYEYYRMVASAPYLPVYITGDVDDDGDITATDALDVLKAVVGKIYLTPGQEIAADVTGDEQVTAADALDILKYVVGKIDIFAVDQL
ncbi:MAG: dockerin type I repeat-containing protein, partial [Clostridia bacterium]|nr:dockerin type I repeat-containing protein [Clostridia bacterium]